MNKTSHLVALILILFLGACASNSSNNNAAEKLKENSEQGYYEAAQKALNAGQFLQAVEKLQALETRYPFSRYAEQAQLELIYAHFRNLDYLDAAIAADRFIRLHPEHPQLDYAYYVKGLAAYHMDRGIFERFIKTDISQRDMGAAKKSFEDFRELINRYPNSEYVADARARMLFLRNLLAEHEVHVARYYMRRQAYLAAANRGQHIVKNYQHTPFVADGLALMVQSYRKLGLTDLADNALNILVYNYPDYPELNDNNDLDEYRNVNDDDISWLNLFTFGLLG